MVPSLHSPISGLDRRLELQTLLEEILGSKNVYFQPPNNLTLKYPAILYSRSGVDETFAGNLPYNHQWRYSITVIDRDPDSKIPQRIATLPKCSFDRIFVSDMLNHSVYNLYF